MPSEERSIVPAHRINGPTRLVADMKHAIYLDNDTVQAERRQRDIRKLPPLRFSHRITSGAYHGGLPNEWTRRSSSDEDEAPRAPDRSPRRCPWANHTVPSANKGRASKEKEMKMAKILCVLYDDPVDGYPKAYARDDIDSAQTLSRRTNAALTESDRFQAGHAAR